MGNGGGWQRVRGLRQVSRRYRRRLSLQHRLCGRPRRSELSQTGQTGSFLWTLSHPRWSLWMAWMDSCSRLGGMSRPCFVTPWCTDRPPCSSAVPADENCVLDAEGNRDTYTTTDAATIIKWRCSEVVRAVSYHEQESKLLVLMDGVPVIQTSKTYKRVTLSANGSLILLSDAQQCNYASVAVRMILRNLATLNGRDADLFQRAFDDLVAYVQNPENALSIQVELLEARIHHINVLDIVFKLVLFGMFDVAQRQLVPRVQGGFLDRLLAVVHAFLPFEACSPAAHQYWQMLQADVRAFLEEVFSLDLSVYSRLQALADGLFSCLERRVDQLLSTLPSP
ncbi:uncharacterized protein LOC121684596 [Alosa sapidissima]|uniref:uncharacterized protein LOC121684596 n=1 Tax=Alosa sapidissima TaxID=34773 RepID=UPI001C08C166|nr:uncharacterized protein LOC121684596 [Alosa sapidissima]